MFKWFEYADVYGHAKAIVDDDFTIELNGGWSNLFVEIIKEYSARNLPVIPNLLLAMKYHSRMRDDYPIASMIMNLKVSHARVYKPYDEELDKYLALV